MPYLLSLLTVLTILTTLACAQPAQDPPKEGQRGAPATPEAQHQPRREGDNRPCEIYLRAPAGIPSNDRAPNLCGNHGGTPQIITKVQCITTQGSLVFWPQLTGGAETSILAAPLTCTPEGAVGVLNGQPRINSFVRNSKECPGGSCTVVFLVGAVNGAQEATLTIVRESE